MCGCQMQPHTRMVVASPKLLLSRWKGLCHHAAARTRGMDVSCAARLVTGLAIVGIAADLNRLPPLTDGASDAHGTFGTPHLSLLL